MQAEMVNAPGSHALTIDVEDWHQMFLRRLGHPMGPPSPSVASAMSRLLDMLDECDVKATFFVVGLLAESSPDLVREIARRGHEVGSHSHHHRLVHSMAPRDFKDEMVRARGFLQDLVGQPIDGFRAPEFSVKELGHWSFDVLAETGFRYDSSVFPARARYGIPDAPRRPFVHHTKSGDLAEFPLAVWGAGPLTVPVAGGSYYRLLPPWLLTRALTSLHDAGTTATLYFHPYEFYSGWLHLTGLSRREQLRPAYWKVVALHNFMTGRISPLLAGLLGRFSFVRLGDLHHTLFGA